MTAPHQLLDFWHWKSRRHLVDTQQNLHHNLFRWILYHPFKPQFPSQKKCWRYPFSRQHRAIIVDPIWTLYTNLYIGDNSPRCVLFHAMIWNHIIIQHTRLPNQKSIVLHTTLAKIIFMNFITIMLHYSLI